MDECCMLAGNGGGNACCGTTENQLKTAVLDLIKRGRNLREQITLLSGDLNYVLKEKQPPPLPSDDKVEKDASQSRITPIKDDLKVVGNTMDDCEAAINDIRGRLWA